jgi:serine/threonine protein kinase/tetratricopeptide (TPR) repeat protein
MKYKTQNDELIMTVVEQALSYPEDEREAYARRTCGDDSELFDEVRSCIQWENRMGDFLLAPLYSLTEDDHPFEPQQLLIHRFRIVREIARGGMGIVYEAFDERLGRRVAIKCARTGLGKELPPEVRNAREISHPNVCKIFEIHTASLPQGEIDFLSMEFLEGETLLERLRRGPLSKQERQTIAIQLCAGLAEAHRNNVIHGDLKSNNVILTTGPDGTVRAVITDFGLARGPGVTDRTGSSSLPAGTPDYMAPELWTGGKASVQSDIYALGVLLWELISGQKPSALGKVSTTVLLDQRAIWKTPAGHGKWNRIIARCLDREPERRFSNVEEVAHALGPSHTRRRFLAVLTGALLAACSGVVTYRIVTAPEETVRLTVGPFEASKETSFLAEPLLRDTATQLARLKGNAHTNLKVISSRDISRHGNVGTTHVLWGTLEKHHETIILHAYLTDLRSSVNAREWKAEYKPEEMQFAPIALAGVVTSTLHLPPLDGVGVVNAAAQKDYSAGLSAVRRDNGVDVALASMERATLADSESPLTFAGLAEAQWFKYFVTEDKLWLNRAAESVRQAQNRYPDLPQVHRIAGLMKYDAGRYEQAIEEYLRAIELDPTNGDGYRRVGQAYQHNNQPEKALAAFHKAIEADPKQYRNHRDLGTFYYDRGDYEQAVKHFGKAVDLAADEPRIHFSLAAAHINLGQFGPAERELRLSLHLRETPVALHALGSVLMYEGQDREAVTNITRALNLAPQTYLGWMNLGTAYRRLHLKSESERAYRRGLDLAEVEMTNNPRNGVVRAHLAYLCAQTGDRQRAESEIAQSLQLSPNDAETHFMAAITYEALGRRNDTLSILASSPASVLRDLSRWPDVADLHKDSRFLQLLVPQVEK